MCGFEIARSIWDWLLEFGILSGIGIELHVCCMANLGLFVKLALSFLGLGFSFGRFCYLGCQGGSGFIKREAIWKNRRLARVASPK